MTDRQEIEVDLFEHTTVNQTFEVRKHVPVFIFSSNRRRERGKVNPDFEVSFEKYAYLGSTKEAIANNVLSSVI
jgi:hypothetical protein